MIPFKLTASTLRTVDKWGGLDQYLLKSPHIPKGSTGFHVRHRIVQKIEHCNKVGIPIYEPIVLPVKNMESAQAVEEGDKLNA